MKSSTLKRIVVKCADFWTDEHEVDSAIFDDVYCEAATRSIDKRKHMPGFQVVVVLETWEKKHAKNPMKHFGYNTYRILINSGLHKKAENLRENFMALHGIDLQKESLRGEETDGGPTPTDQPKPE